MYNVRILYNGCEKTIQADKGAKLSEVLCHYGISAHHPCGGRGVCKKCAVTVNGKKELSCTYRINEDITVLIEEDNIESVTGTDETKTATDNMCLCFDIGTTTLALALVSLDEGNIIATVVENNPQRAFAADVMSRIDYVGKNGVLKMQQAVISAVNSMAEKLLKQYGIARVEKLYVAGNMTMLHLFFGIDCTGMGVSPYEPVFLDKKALPSEKIGINCSRKVISLCGISAFVGADIVAGLGYVGMPEKGKYNLLIDLGTNAEIVLYSENVLLCTAAAAGPCFEGVNISCGMSAVKGAVYSYNGKLCLTIGGGEAKGVCATGLIDALAVMLNGGIVDETGFLTDKEFEIAKDVRLTQEDIRQFQLAKSAIYSGIIALIKKQKISFNDIDKVFVAGGFSAKMNLGNAIRVGLLPKEVQGRFYPVNNSSLLGCVKHACENNSFDAFLKNARYVDLAKDEYFQNLFIENMMFE
ncbi:MAG: DUF4445 domain-containing protein [Clostridia bacterium]|nr:DUF4445 domain-containing protein [Clostridia bacterium]